MSRKQLILPPVPSLVENGEYYFNLYMYTKEQLRDLLRQKGAITKGSKDDLVERLLSVMTELEMYRMLKGNCHHALRQEGRGGFETKLRGEQFQSHASVKESEKKGLPIGRKSKRHFTPIYDKERFLKSCEPARKKAETRISPRRISPHRELPLHTGIPPSNVPKPTPRRIYKEQQPAPSPPKPLPMPRKISPPKPLPTPTPRRIPQTETLDIREIMRAKKEAEDKYVRTHPEARRSASSRLTYTIPQTETLDIREVLRAKKEAEDVYYRTQRESPPPEEQPSQLSNVAGYVSSAASFLGNTGSRFFGYLLNSIPQTSNPPQQTQAPARQSVTTSVQAPVRHSVTMPVPTQTRQSVTTSMQAPVRHSVTMPVPSQLPTYNFPEVPTYEFPKVSPPKTSTSTKKPVLVEVTPLPRETQSALYPHISPVRKSNEKQVQRTSESKYKIPKAHVKISPVRKSNEKHASKYKIPEARVKISPVRKSNEKHASKYKIPKAYNDIEISDDELEGLLHSPVKQTQPSKYAVSENYQISDDLLDSLDDLIAARKIQSPKPFLPPPSPDASPKRTSKRKTPVTLPPSPIVSPKRTSNRKSPIILPPPSPVVSPKRSSAKKSPKFPKFSSAKKSPKFPKISDDNRALYYAVLSKVKYPSSPVQKVCHTTTGTLSHICVNCFTYKDIKKILIDKCKIKSSQITNKDEAIRLLFKKLRKNDIIDLLKTNDVIVSSCDSKRVLLMKLWADKPISPGMKVSTECLTCNKKHKLRIA